MEDLEDEATNGLNDWESLPSTHSHNHHYYSSHNLSLPSITTSHNHDHHLSIFPPINHEGLPPPPPPPSLPLLPPPHAPLSFSNSDSDSLSPSPPKRRVYNHFINWFHFAIRLYNSKLLSFITLLRSRRIFSFILPLASTASFFGLFWIWVRRRRRLRSNDGKESVERLKVLIKEKDEKIIQLLEQIAVMNKALLARYRIPVLRAS
ncbi:hypothetical protein BVRB_5g114190 isoform A [Beta vulgaris subsp. vulgaris]|nr:hypothetical protein BVRB_5g114190 isoform A [Beta vulgaris subsp. vulgaris]